MGSFSCRVPIFVCNMIVVIKMGAYIYGVVVFYGCLLSRFYGSLSIGPLMTHLYTWFKFERQLLSGTTTQLCHIWEGRRPSFCYLNCHLSKSSITEECEKDEYHLRFTRIFYTFTILAWKLVDFWFTLYLLSSLHQMTPLHVAAERGYTNIVDYLVSKGADIDIGDKSGVMICDSSNDREIHCSEFENIQIESPTSLFT